MLHWYISIVKSYPILSAMVQFAILGTLGEVISYKFRGGRGYPFSFFVTLGKALGWAILAVMIKYAFTGFTGFVEVLAEHGMLPAATMSQPVLFAFFKSTFTNLMFGPILVVTHRLFDNIVEGKNNWKNLKPAFLLLLWFWIPAHTLTFALPVEFQIGLAALWSVVLGMFLGFFARR